MKQQDLDTDSDRFGRRLLLCVRFSKKHCQPCFLLIFGVELGIFVGRKFEIFPTRIQHPTLTGKQHRESNRRHVKPIQVGVKTNKDRK